MAQACEYCTVSTGLSRRIGFVKLVVGLGERQAFRFHGDDDVVVLKGQVQHNKTRTVLNQLGTMS